MKKIFLIKHETFTYNFSDKPVTLRDCSLVDVLDKLDDYRVVTNDRDVASQLSQYLRHPVELVDTDSIVESNDLGFIVIPPVCRGSDYGWVKITPLEVVKHAHAIYKLHMERQERQLAVA